jgi:hypothetical protein
LKIVGSRAQFLGLLLTRNRGRTPEMPFRFRRIQLLRQQRDFAGNAMAFGFVPAEMQRFRAASTAFRYLGLLLLLTTSDTRVISTMG